MHVLLFTATHSLRKAIDKLCLFRFLSHFRSFKWSEWLKPRFESTTSIWNKASTFGVSQGCWRGTSLWKAPSLPFLFFCLQQWSLLHSVSGTCLLLFFWSFPLLPTAVILNKYKVLKTIDLDIALSLSHSFLRIGSRAGCLLYFSQNDTSK